MAMNDSHMQEILDLERQKIAIQHSAAEARMDVKIEASEKRIIHAVTNAITGAVVELKREIIGVRIELKQDIADVRTELKQDIADVRTEIANVRTELTDEIRSVRTELKGDIARLEQKIDCHAH
ncbi:hypothetical protein ACIBG4_14260 [Nonomuraea sp. NPDC050383]|uniref:hypothetical protein n=1 Tax=Nonomuraea sp. NPDC050383 TaxID=3364362 RepID=UPI0037A28D3B